MEKNGIIEQVREEVFPSDKAAEKPLGKYCDHTVLRAYTTRETVKRFCEEAVRYGAASVCVNPVHVAYVHELLRGTGLYTCTVIGFPLGANRSCVKAMEAALAVEDGADEVDMVMNIGALREKDYELVRRDIAGVVAAAAGRREGQGHHRDLLPHRPGDRRGVAALPAGGRGLRQDLPPASERTARGSGMSG